MADAARTHFRTCHLCEAMCGIAIDLAGDRIVAIRGDKDDPFSRGHICPKAVALEDVQDDPDRLRRPLRRTASGWEEVSWQAALDEAATRLAAVQRAHGRNAVAVYQGNPVVHNHGAILFGQALPGAPGQPQPLLGHLGRPAAPDARLAADVRAPAAAAGARRRPHRLPARARRQPAGIERQHHDGARHREAAQSAARPRRAAGRGRPAADRDRRRSPTSTSPSAPAATRSCSPRCVQTLARRGAPGSPAGSRPSPTAWSGSSQQSGPSRPRPWPSGPGSPPRRSAAGARLRRRPRPSPTGASAPAPRSSAGSPRGSCSALNVVTGNLDRPGGAMFPSPAVDIVAFADRIGHRGHFDKGRSRVRGLPEFGGEWPVGGAGRGDRDAGRGPGPGAGDERRQPGALDAQRRPARPRARRARLHGVDRPLPQRDHAPRAPDPAADVRARARRTTTSCSTRSRCATRPSTRPPLFPAPEGSRHDWQILLELATRLEKARGEGGLRSWLRHRVFSALGPDGVVALLLRFGPRGAGLVPFGRGLSLGRLRRAPHGIDFGPLEPSLPQRLYTKTRRIELAPGRLVEDLARLRLALEAPVNGGLTLVGRRELRSNNSWMHNSERLVKGRERCTLLMHPEDASARGLVGGERVRVSSRTGAVEVPLEVSSDMRPGSSACRTAGDTGGRAPVSPSRARGPA